MLTDCKGLVCQICFPECRFGIKCPLCGSKDCQCHKFGTDEQVKLLEGYYNMTHILYESYNMSHNMTV